MDEVLELASRLGKAIAGSVSFIELRKIEESLTDDDEARQLAVSLAEQTLKIRRLEQETKPVEVADKHLLEELRGKVASHPVLKELARAQADFTDSMNRINRAIDRELQPASGDTKESPGDGM